MTTPDPAVQGDGTTADTENPKYARRWWMLALLGTAQLMVVLDVTIVNIALPHAQAALGFSNTDRQWIVTGYSLAFGSLLLLGGRIADLFGRKRVFLIGVVGFAAASAFGGAAQNFDMLLTARVVQGAFGALLAPATLSLLTTTFTEPAERTKATGHLRRHRRGRRVGRAAARRRPDRVPELALGHVRERADRGVRVYRRRDAARVNVAAPDTAQAGPGRYRAGRGRPVLPGLRLLQRVHVAGQQRAGPSRARWATLIGGVVLLVAFVLVEQRVANPLLPLRVVLDRNRGGAYLAMFLAAIGMFGVFLFLTYYLEETLGYSAVKTGLVVPAADLDPGAGRGPRQHASC